MRRAALLLAALASACASVPSEAPRRPNIVLFLVDDLGWQDISVPLGPERTPFNDRYRTPNVERLAREGISFTQAYAAAPVCTPTRTAILSGQAPARSHITYWTLRKDTDTSAKFAGLLPPKWDVNALQPEDTTLPELLRQAGYRTIHVGKAHFGAVGTPGADPRNLGFDVNVAGHGAGGPGSFLGLENFSAAARKGDRVWDVPGLERWHGKDVFLEEALAAEAVEQIDAAVAAGMPFFLNFAPYSVHAPITANQRYAASYGELDPREAAYATMVETFDAALGVLLARLDAHGIADDTLVIFTSDNGGLSAHARGGEPHTHNAPLRSGKGSCYEGGVRVPMIVRWPGITPRSGRTAHEAISHDLFPTILAAAGAGRPGDGLERDGRDLGAALRGAEGATGRRLVWHQPHFWGVKGPGIWPFSALREGRWKLVYRHADRGFELYDLERDLGEAHDLAALEPDRVRELASKLGSELRAMGAQMSVDAERHAPVPWPDELGR